MGSACRWEGHWLPAAAHGPGANWATHGGEGERKGAGWGVGLVASQLWPSAGSGKGERREGGKFGWASRAKKDGERVFVLPFSFLLFCFLLFLFI